MLLKTLYLAILIIQYYDVTDRIVPSSKIIQIICFLYPMTTIPQCNLIEIQ